MKTLLFLLIFSISLKAASYNVIYNNESTIYTVSDLGISSNGCVHFYTKDITQIYPFNKSVLESLKRSTNELIFCGNVYIRHQY